MKWISWPSEIKKKANSILHTIDQYVKLSICIDMDAFRVVSLFDVILGSMV